MKARREMLAKVFGVVAATVAMYAWGFFVWGMKTLPYQYWQPPGNEIVAAEVIKIQFPNPGVYRLPAQYPTMPPIERDPRAVQEPPIAFAHFVSMEPMTNRDQRGDGWCGAFSSISL